MKHSNIIVYVSIGIIFFTFSMCVNSNQDVKNSNQELKKDHTINNKSFIETDKNSTLSNENNITTKREGYYLDTVIERTGILK